MATYNFDGFFGEAIGEKDLLHFHLYIMYIKGVYKYIYKMDLHV